VTAARARLAPAPAAPAPPPPCGTLAGRVIERGSAGPLPGATVRIGERVTVSDDAGAFELDEVCSAGGTLVVSAAGYRTARMPAPPSADDPLLLALDPEDIAQADDVVVEAPRPTRSGAEARAVIDGAALERLRGLSLTDALQTVPGVRALRGTAGGVGQPIIRGQTGRRNLVLYDGVRLQTQSWGLEHGPELDPYAAQRLTVIRGPGALEYGQDAVGGVANAEPAALRSAPGGDGEAQAIGASNGLRGALALRVDGASARARGLAWRVDGNVTRGRALQTPDYPLDNTGSRQWNAGGVLGWSAGPVELSLTYRHYDLLAGVCSCLRNSTPEDFAQAFELGVPINVELYRADYAVERAYQEVRHDLGLARARVATGEAGELVLTYAIQRNDRREYDVVRAGVTGPQYRFDLLGHEGSVVFAHTPVAIGNRGGRLEGQVGAQAWGQSHEFTSERTLVPSYGAVWGGPFAIERVLIDPVELSAAIRWDGLWRRAELGERDFVGQTGSGRLDPERCDPSAGGGADCTQTFGSVGGDLGVTVYPGHGARVALEAHTTGRPPAIDESYLNGGTPTFPVLGLGDANLGLERTYGGSLTAGFELPWASTEVSGFVDRIDDYIYFRPVGLQDTVRGTFQVFAFEPVDALFWGVEQTAAVEAWGGWLRLDGSWAIVRGAQRPSGDPLVFVPPDRAGLGVSVHPPDRGRIRGLMAGISGDFIDRQRRFEEDVDFVDPPPGYALLGASAGVGVALERGVLRFQLEGRNLTNARYRDYTSLLRYFADDPGWDLSLRIAWQFELPAANSRGRQGTAAPAPSR
jgi:iron complex outermembrane receptor protein